MSWLLCDTPPRDRARRSSRTAWQASFIPSSLKSEGWVSRGERDGGCRVWGVGVGRCKALKCGGRVIFVELEDRYRAYRILPPNPTQIHPTRNWLHVPKRPSQCGYVPSTADEPGATNAALAFDAQVCCVLCCVVLCCVVLCCVVLCCVVLCCAVLCCVVLCCAVLCCVVSSQPEVRI